MSLFEGSPAYRSGIRRGDVIARIEGPDPDTGKTTMLDTKNWTSEQAVRKLKGPKGTKVNISIRRPGYDKLIDMDVERDEVNITTVRGAFMIDATTGYIKLGDFSETSDREVGQAIEKLTSQGMKRLVFDLRDNPGGPLDQAIRIANRFLPRGDMIVYTRGRIPNADQDYHATDDPDYAGPMLVLVNRNSASASEIVTGSLQDHDRALIVGETTFGKALVQSVYTISEKAGLALTTGRYFTPSGRMIQRPWDGAFDEYLTYTLRDQKAERDQSSTQLKYTDAGRKVYSGGGIEPDKFFGGPCRASTRPGLAAGSTRDRRSPTTPSTTRRKGTRGWPRPPKARSGSREGSSSPTRWSRTSSIPFSPRRSRSTRRRSRRTWTTSRR